MGTSKASSAGNVKSSTFLKALRPRQEWENKEVFLDVIYWFRQLMSLVLGILWGCIPLHGMLGLGTFFAVNAGVIYCYYAFYQRVDEDDYGGPWELLKEGMMTSFALFLVCWILTYSSLQF